jgi:hypothetical protein
MYSAKKSNSIPEAEARKVAGNEAVDSVLDENCDFTGRVIDDCFGVTEMSASVDIEIADGDECTLTVLYLVDSDSLSATDDLGDLDYSNYSFEIN